MTINLDIGSQRTIYEAGDITYNDSALHPTRINPKFHDIVYMEDGTWNFRVNGCVYEVGPGDVFILPAMSVYEGVSECIPHTRTFFVHVFPLPDDFIENEHSEDSANTNIIPLGNVIHTGGDSTIQSLFLEIVMMKYSDNPRKDILMSTLFNSLIGLIYMYSKKTIIKSHDLVTECMNIIHRTPDKFYKETEMAEMMFVSSKTLRTSFLKRFNKSFYKFQLDYKLAQALYMLKNDPNIKIYEIAYALGFSDEFHLSKLFKKKYGMSPSEYKKRHSVH